MNGAPTPNTPWRSPIQRRLTLALAAAAAFVLTGCASTGGWTTLIDGEKGLDNFNRVGDANWRAEGGGKWNTYEAEARGSQVTVKLNGETTVVMNNGKFAAGPIALQYGPGVQGVQGGPIKWRQVSIRPL